MEGESMEEIIKSSLFIVVNQVLLSKIQTASSVDILPINREMKSKLI